MNGRIHAQNEHQVNPRTSAILTIIDRTIHADVLKH